MIFSVLIAKEGKENDLRKALFELVPQVRKADKGCMHYDMHEEIGKPGHIFFYEVWDSRENWDVHMQKEYVKKFNALCPTLTTSTSMNICKKSI